ncbi:MAG: hypothetical protein U0353_15340 [Sandaracinus sp.]
MERFLQQLERFLQQLERFLQQLERPPPVTRLDPSAMLPLEVAAPPPQPAATTLLGKLFSFLAK